MKDERKTKAQLIEELDGLRGEMSDLREKIAGVDVSGVERQLASERVRSSVLACRRTEELLQVAALIEQELRGLGVRFTGMGIALYDESDNFHRFSAGEGRVTKFTSDQNRKNVLSQWRKGQVWGRTRSDQVVGVASQAVVNVPFDRGFLTMGNTEIEEFSEKDVEILKSFTNVVSLAYTRYLDLLAVEDARSQRLAALEDELQTARRMQTGLMPTAPPTVSGLSVAGGCRPADEVGGDLFQYFRDRSLFIGLADVTGHAMEAAIPVVMFSGILDNQMETPNPLPDLFRSLNRSLCRSLSDHKFICFTMAEIEDKTLRLASCGNPYPLHFHNGEVTELRVDGYPLGVREGTQYEAIKGQLHEGDYLVLYSDGIPETINPSEEMYGYERTIETVREGCSEGISAEDLVETLMSKAREFAEEEPQADDMTCVVVRVEA